MIDTIISYTPPIRPVTHPFHERAFHHACGLLKRIPREASVMRERVGGLPCFKQGKHTVVAFEFFPYLHVSDKNDKNQKARGRINETKSQHDKKNAQFKARVNRMIEASDGTLTAVIIPKDKGQEERKVQSVLPHLSCRLYLVCPHVGD